MKEMQEKVTIIKSNKGIVKTVNSNTTSDEEKVNAWLGNLDPKVKFEINGVRRIIKNAGPKLNERIKWNAPGYFYKEDIVTFGPCKEGKFLLVFHHPSVIKVKSDVLEGHYKDRRLIYFKNKAEAQKNKDELSRIINEIVKSIDNK